LIEYKKEAYVIFQKLLGSIQRNTVGTMLRIHINVEVPENTIAPSRIDPSKLQTNQSQIEGNVDRSDIRPDPISATTVVANRIAAKSQTPKIMTGTPEVGRNDPCPCGSEKKYKKCHG